MLFHTHTHTLTHTHIHTDTHTNTNIPIISEIPMVGTLNYRTALGRKLPNRYNMQLNLTKGLEINCEFLGSLNMKCTLR